jgi:L-amino acid N-acyltransferase YncA
MMLEIRKINNEKEIKETSAIYIECWHNDYASFIPQEVLWSMDIDNEAKDCKEWLQHDTKNQLFAGFINNEMVGYISVSPHKEEPKYYEVELSGFFVRKDFRNKGYGLKLLYHAVCELINQNVRSIIVYSFKDSKSNSFYRSLGGSEIKKENQYIGSKPMAIECFGWEIKSLYSILSEKVKKY